MEWKLNGEKVVSQAKATERLLDVLRDEFHLTSPKCGCKEGECGACSVLLDGMLVNSCLVAMGAVMGREVVTMEGFRQTEAFRVLDACFAAVSAVQCGYCIPGMILAAHCLLKHHPHPTEAQIRAGISGNLCRCTGYEAIVRAIEMAAKEGKGLW
ncbi:MAG: (2Fe-2S)-binding protein [Clostridia bacterium]